jgi:hypothetical protein
LGGLAYERIFASAGNLLSRISAAVICIAALLFVFPLLGPKPNFPLPPWALDPAVYRTKRETTTVGEYLPIWAQEIEAPRGFENGVKIEGEGRIESARRKAGKIDATLELEAPGRVVLQDLYFPGWKVLANQGEVRIAPEEKTGRMSVQLPPGRHELEARLTLTPVRKVSGILSASTGILLLTCAAGSAVRASRRAR